MTTQSKSVSASKKGKTTKEIPVGILEENQMQNMSAEKNFDAEIFRVAIFGSARIKPNDALFEEVMYLAKDIANMNADVVTGGGPGIMEAANIGHQMGSDGQSKSIGLTIELPWENEGNHHLDKQQHFQKFSNRLDTFMNLSNAVIVMPGGIGTCLELFYAWQLMQVHHVCSVPIILYGEMWHKLFQWVKENPLKDGLVSPEDLYNVFCVKNKKEAMKILQYQKEKYDESNGSYCITSKEFENLNIL